MAIPLRPALYPEPTMASTRPNGEHDQRASPPVASLATRRAAMDNAVSGMRTALVSLSWARNSLGRAAIYGAPREEIELLEKMLARAEEFLEGAEAAVVARLAYGEELPAAIEYDPDGEDA